MLKILNLITLFFLLHQVQFIFAFQMPGKQSIKSSNLFNLKTTYWVLPWCAKAHNNYCLIYGFRNDYTFQYYPCMIYELFHERYLETNMIIPEIVLIFFSLYD